MDLNDLYNEIELALVGERSLPSEVGAGLLRGVQGIDKSVRGFQEMLGDPIMRALGGPMAPLSTAKKRREEASKPINRLAPSKSVREGDVLQPGNPNWWAAKLSEMAPQMALQGGLAASTGGGSVLSKMAMWAGSSGVLSTGNAYADSMARLEEKGVPEGQREEIAAATAISTGVGTTLLETIPGAAFFVKKNPAAKNVLQKIIAERVAARLASGAVSEGFEEVAQEAWSDFSQLHFEGNKEAFKDAGKRYIAAGMLGAAAGGAFKAGQEVTTSPAPEFNAQKIVEEAGPEAVEGLLNDLGDEPSRSAWRQATGEDGPGLAQKKKMIGELKLALDEHYTKVDEQIAEEAKANNVPEYAVRAFPGDPGKQQELGKVAEEVAADLGQDINSKEVQVGAFRIYNEAIEDAQTVLEEDEVASESEQPPPKAGPLSGRRRPTVGEDNPLLVAHELANDGRISREAEAAAVERFAGQEVSPREVQEWLVSEGHIDGEQPKAGALAGGRRPAIGGVNYPLLVAHELADAGRITREAEAAAVKRFAGQEVSPQEVQEWLLSEGHIDGHNQATQPTGLGESVREGLADGPGHPGQDSPNAKFIHVTPEDFSEFLRDKDTGLNYAGPGVYQLSIEDADIAELYSTWAIGKKFGVDPAKGKPGTLLPANVVRAIAIGDPKHIQTYLEWGRKKRAQEKDPEERLRWDEAIRQLQALARGDIKANALHIEYDPGKILDLGPMVPEGVEVNRKTLYTAGNPLSPDDLDIMRRAAIRAGADPAKVEAVLAETNLGMAVYGKMTRMVGRDGMNEALLAEGIDTIKFVHPPRSAPRPYDVYVALKHDRPKIVDKSKIVGGKLAPQSDALMGLPHESIPTQEQPPAGPQPKRPVEQQRVVRTMERDWGTTLRRGKVSHNQALMEYLYNRDVIRAQDYAWADMGAMSHEIAHVLDQSLGLTGKYGSGQAIPDHVLSEVAQLDYSDTETRPHEGFAEFMRLYMTDPDAAADRAPEMLAWFEGEWLPQHPVEAERIAKHRGLISQWRKQGAEARLRAQIAEDPKENRPYMGPVDAAKDWAKSVLGRAYTNWIDRFAVLRKIDEGFKGLGGKQALPLHSRATVTQMASTAYAEQALTDGVAAVPKAHRVGEEAPPGEDRMLGDVSLSKSIQANIEGTTAAQRSRDLRKASHYMVAKHVLTAREQNPDYEVGISKKDLDSALDVTPEAAARYDRLHQDLTQFNRDLVSMLVDAGVITADESSRLLAYEDYVPLFRNEGKGRARGNTITNGNPARRRTKTGSMSQILSPIDATIIQANEFYQAALDQQLKMHLLYMASPELGGVNGMGWAAQIVKPDTKVTKIQVQEILDKLVKLGFVDEDHAADLRDAWDPMTAGSAEDLGLPDFWTTISIFRQAYEHKPGKYLAPMVVEGQRQLVEYDKDVYDTLSYTGDMGVARGFVRNLGKLSQLVRFGATGLNIAFAPKNLIRDWAQYQVQAEHAGPNSMSDPWYWLMAGWAAEVAGKENIVYNLWKESGGKLATRLGHDQSPTSVASVRKAMTKKGLSNYRRIDWETPRELVVGLAEIVGTSDVGPRLAEFYGVLKEAGYTIDPDNPQQFLKNGKPAVPDGDLVLAAQMAASESTTNFKTVGKYGMVANKMIPFFNANLQGHSKFLRTMMNGRNKKRKLIAGAAAIAISAAYWASRRDDDDYNESPGWLRWNYWTFGWGGQTYIRIPKPHDYRILSNAVEAVLDTTLGKDTGRKDQIKESIFDYAASWKPPTDVVLLTPIIETWGNWDSFRGREIETPRDKTLQPGYRYDHNTTKTAKLLGRMFPKLISPKKLDHFLSKSTADYYNNPGRKLGQPLSGLTVRDSFSKHRDTFYKTHDRLKKELATLKHQGKDQPSAAVQQSLQMDEYRTLMGNISRVRGIREDRGERFAYNKYLIGLSREALGLPEIASYPTIFTPGEELPADLRALRNDFIQRQQKIAGTPMPQVRYARHKTYRETVHWWLNRHRAAVVWLSRHGYPIP